jgi:hypothetical protein
MDTQINIAAANALWKWRAELNEQQRRDAENYG